MPANDDEQKDFIPQTDKFAVETFLLSLLKMSLGEEI
jgi:hypothetical protein